MFDIQKTEVQLVLLLILVAVIGGGVWYYGHTRYNAGFKDSDTAWVKKYNTQIEALNKHIADLETQSKKDVSDLNADKILLAKQLDSTVRELTDAKAKLAFNQRHNAAGGVVIPKPCLTDKGTPAPATDDGTVYLGPEFTALWNGLNRDVNSLIGK